LNSIAATDIDPSKHPGPVTIINGGQFNHAGRDIHHHTHYHVLGSASLLKGIPNFRKIHIATLGRATPDTGYWIFVWETFQIWISTDGYIKIMWGSGMRMCSIFLFEFIGLR
jgi:hypothetical protein